VADLLGQTRYGAFAGAADASQMLELAVERFGGAQVTLPRGIILGGSGARGELRGTRLEIVLQRERRGPPQLGRARGESQRGQRERVEHAAQIGARSRG